MGVDGGFDIYPRLSTGIVDRHNWGRFIDFVKERYKDDTQVEVEPNYIISKAGEHPQLPFEGHKFLHFSSKVSGSIAADTDVESYIDTVTRMAQANFGSRTWSYEQRDEPETPYSISQFLSGTDTIVELGIAPFEIKQILGKGKGLVARFNISKGTRIICEKPLLKDIKNLDDAIGDPFRMKRNPQESLRDCYSLIQVLDQEFDGCALLASLYYDVFQTSIAHRDQARVSIFAERAYKARVICEGEDRPETR
ncbi:hypothetical protein BPOR_0815g00040 [Botrytis porri]|uniref:Uncharacterized protein n=1 Tax=Botrytis porri TaxID=87229 RepID=A0A4Z1KG34_9HELO|nr:hypothetical protein BPOR_0815g00040 [Botrytis porri]